MTIFRRAGGPTCDGREKPGIIESWTHHESPHVTLEVQFDPHSTIISVIQGSRGDHKCLAKHTASAREERPAADSVPGQATRHSVRCVEGFDSRGGAARRRRPARSHSSSRPAYSSFETPAFGIYPSTSSFDPRAPVQMKSRRLRNNRLPPEPPTPMRKSIRAASASRRFRRSFATAAYRRRERFTSRASAQTRPRRWSASKLRSKTNPRNRTEGCEDATIVQR